MPPTVSKNKTRSSSSLSVNSVRALRRKLLAWYRKHHRQLPWRPTPGTPGSSKPAPLATTGSKITPYHIMVSEAMLQQTQVATVIPYFERFIGAFPTLHDLAAADEQDVLRLWQGLGYYRRARNLHAAAKTCVEQFGDTVPATVDELLTLPGVGRYTAGAIASIAYHQPAPILDGNVARVLARIFAIEDAIDKTPTRNRLWQLAEELVPSKVPGDFNQAMMELGATVCTPRDAKCLYCPVRDMCEAYTTGRVAELPRVSPRKQPKAVTHHVLAIHRNGKYLFERRPSTGLWSAMWQLPTAESLDGKTLDMWARDRFGLHIDKPQTLGRFKHQTTHRTIRFEVSITRAAAGRLRRGAGVWRKLQKIDDLPMSNPQQHVVEMLKDDT